VAGTYDPTMRNSGLPYASGYHPCKR